MNIMDNSDFAQRCREAWKKSPAYRAMKAGKPLWGKPVVERDAGEDREEQNAGDGALRVGENDSALKTQGNVVSEGIRAHPAIPGLNPGTTPEPAPDRWSSLAVDELEAEFSDRANP